MPDNFNIWLDGVPVVDSGGSGKLEIWLSGVPVVERGAADGIPCTGNLFFKGCGNDCEKLGHKGINARKSWHGVYAYDREIGCRTPSATIQSTDLVKYLTHSVEVTISSTAHTIDNSFTSWVDEATALRCEQTAEHQQERAATSTVNRYSGVQTISGCTDSRVETYNTVNDPKGGCNQSANTFFADIQCISGGPYFRAWVDIMTYLTACDGVISSTIGMAGCPAETGQYGGTPAQIMAYWNSLNSESSETFYFIDEVTSDCVVGHSRTSFASDCVVSLGPTSIEWRITLNSSSESTGFMSIPGTDAGGHTCAGGPIIGHPRKVNANKPTSSSATTSGSIHVVVTLSNPYTYAQLNSDVDGLLATRKLTDMTDYTWHHSCSYPLVKYDESDPSIPFGWQGSCSWVDPLALAPNGDAGNGFTGALLNGSGAIKKYQSNSGVLDGAFKYNTGGVLFACKYAEILLPRPGHNFYRPCGDDRDLFSNLSWNVTDATNANPIVITTDDALDTIVTGDRIYISGVGGNTAANDRHWPVVRLSATTFSLTGSIGNGDYTSGGNAALMRFPTAWPICGHLTVTGATNASPIVVTTETNHLLDADKVDIAGVLGNTAANGSDLYVKPLTPTTFELYSDAALTTPIAGNGAYTSGGTVKNPASASPPSETYNTDASRGDFVVLFYAFDNRQIGIDPTIRKYNGSCYSFTPPIRHLGGPSGLDTIAQGNIAGAGVPKIVCISPSGEAFGANSVTYSFPAFAMPLVVDELYGAKWCGQVRQHMSNPINMVSLADYVETRIAPPAGQPSIPEARGGAASNVKPYGISGIKILGVTQITTLGDASGGGPCPIAIDEASPFLPQKVEPVFGVCVAFDEDSGYH